MSDYFHAPCVFCDYNGPGFFQSNTHPCSAKSTRENIDALRAQLAAAEKERKQYFDELMRETFDHRHARTEVGRLTGELAAAQAKAKTEAEERVLAAALRWKKAGFMGRHIPAEELYETAEALEAQRATPGADLGITSGPASGKEQAAFFIAPLKPVAQIEGRGE
jgi:hypothetical protein